MWKVKELSIKKNFFNKKKRLNINIFRNKKFYQDVWIKYIYAKLLQQKVLRLCRIISYNLNKRSFQLSYAKTHPFASNILHVLFNIHIISWYFSYSYIFIHYIYALLSIFFISIEEEKYIYIYENENIYTTPYYIHNLL